GFEIGPVRAKVGFRPKWATYVHSLLEPHLAIAVFASGGFPRPTTKEWGEGPSKIVEASRTVPSPQPFPHWSLSPSLRGYGGASAGRGSKALLPIVVAFRRSRLLALLLFFITLNSRAALQFDV